jgi:hypothetical protein
MIGMLNECSTEGLNKGCFCYWNNEGIKKAFKPMIRDVDYSVERITLRETATSFHNDHDTVHNMIKQNKSSSSHAL